MLEEIPEIPEEVPEDGAENPEPVGNKGKACPSCGAFYVSEDVAHVHNASPVIVDPEILEDGDPTAIDDPEAPPEPEPTQKSRTNFSTIFYSGGE